MPLRMAGFLVLPVVDGGLQWVLAILAGTVVGGILFTAFKKAEWTKAQREATAEVAVNDAPLLSTLPLRRLKPLLRFPLTPTTPRAL